MDYAMNDSLQILLCNWTGESYKSAKNMVEYQNQKYYKGFFFFFSFYTVQWK